MRAERGITSANQETNELYQNLQDNMKYAENWSFSEGDDTLPSPTIADAFVSLNKESYLYNIKDQRCLHGTERRYGADSRDMRATAYIGANYFVDRDRVPTFQAEDTRKIAERLHDFGAVLQVGNEKYCRAFEVELNIKIDEAFRAEEAATRDLIREMILTPEGPVSTIGEMHMTISNHIKQNEVCPKMRKVIFAAFPSFRHQVDCFKKRLVHEFAPIRATLAQALVTTNFAQNPNFTVPKMKRLVENITKREPEPYTLRAFQEMMHMQAAQEEQWAREEQLRERDEKPKGEQRTFKQILSEIRARILEEKEVNSDMVKKINAPSSLANMTKNHTTPCRLFTNECVLMKSALEQEMRKMRDNSVQFEKLTIELLGLALQIMVRIANSDTLFSESINSYKMDICLLVSKYLKSRLATENPNDLKHHNNLRTHTSECNVHFANKCLHERGVIHAIHLIRGMIREICNEQIIRYTQSNNRIAPNEQAMFKLNRFMMAAYEEYPIQTFPNIPFAYVELEYLQEQRNAGLIDTVSRSMMLRVGLPLSPQEFEAEKGETRIGALTTVNHELLQVMLPLADPGFIEKHFNIAQIDAISAARGRDRPPQQQVVADMLEIFVIYIRHRLANSVSIQQKLNPVKGMFKHQLSIMINRIWGQIVDRLVPNHHQFLQVPLHIDLYWIRFRVPDVLNKTYDAADSLQLQFVQYRFGLDWVVISDSNRIYTWMDNDWNKEQDPITWFESAPFMQLVNKPLKVHYTTQKMPMVKGCFGSVGSRVPMGFQGVECPISNQEQVNGVPLFHQAAMIAEQQQTDWQEFAMENPDYDEHPGFDEEEELPTNEEMWEMMQQNAFE